MAEEQQALLGPDAHNGSGASLASCMGISPKVTTLVIKRIVALTNKLLPLQVDPEEIKSPTSGIITGEVIRAYAECAGDYVDCVPYCLLIARWVFHREALKNPSDFDENEGRKLACEVLARRLVGKLPLSRQHIVLSTRYTRLESDGDVSLPTSAIELACDQQCTVFLSSSESQRCIFALWNGYLVQALDDRGHVVYAVYRRVGKGSFLDHFDVSRLAVPRYSNIFRIVLWVFFLVWYSIALQTPDRAFGIEDILLYVQVFGYSLELVTRAWKIFTFSVFTFWFCIDIAIYTLLLIAFGFRVADLSTTDPDRTSHMRLRAFQVTSCAAPLIWAKLLPIFDTWSFFGTLQIVVSRMLRESAVFFALLLLLGVGFAQSLIGLDVADKSTDVSEQIFHSLLQGLLGSPNFDAYRTGADGYQFALTLYYLWNIATVVILVNLLVALFGSAYADVTDDAMDFYLAFFSTKTVTAVRAPDAFVYCAPFNLLELLVLPLEPFVSPATYAAINRALMGSLFFLPLCAIALFESRFESARLRRFARDMDPDEDEEVVEDPETPAGEAGAICVASFEQLTRRFPDLTASVGGATLQEVKGLKRDIAELKAQLRALAEK